MAVDYSELPGDLVTEILLRLPVKSIIRFNSVAKNWYHLFKTPSFISQHSCLSKKMNKKNKIHNVINVRQWWSQHKFEYQMLRFGDDGKTLVSSQDFHQVPHHLVGRRDYSMVVGDGLICFGGLGGMTLWNPATKKFRILPDFNRYMPFSTLRFHAFRHIFGCGMDASSNDYKVLVVRMYIFRSRDMDQYAIYRMSSDSWRVFKEEELELINDQLHRIHEDNMGTVCINGVFYWQGCQSNKLLAFHLDTEAFEILPSPGKRAELLVLHDGRLASCEWEWMDSNRNGVIWVMNDDDQGNWTKLFNINPTPGVICMRMYGFGTHGKVFLQVNYGVFNSHKLFLYDIETGEFIDLGMEGGPWVFIYQQSLLAVAPSPY